MRVSVDVTFRCNDACTLVGFVFAVEFGSHGSCVHPGQKSGALSPATSALLRATAALAAPSATANSSPRSAALRSISSIWIDSNCPWLSQLFIVSGTRKPELWHSDQFICYLCAWSLYHKDGQFLSVGSSRKPKKRAPASRAHSTAMSVGSKNYELQNKPLPIHFSSE